MSTRELIHNAVREHYAERIQNNAPCCAPSGDASAGTSTCCSAGGSLYPADLLAALPGGETVVSYGCGDPITLASLQPGQTVLDLGSGAGLDCFLAAKQVGAEGRVIGVDMTPEMIERARASATRLDLANVEFRQGFMEDLPVEDASVDVVISNCVINLAPEKSPVFTEAFRVLKAGGLLAVSDIVTEGPLPAEVRQSLSAWAGCIAGAVDVQDYLQMMQSAGFTDISIAPVFFDTDTVEAALNEITKTTLLPAFSRDEVNRSIYSARITAHKPA